MNKRYWLKGIVKGALISVAWTLCSYVLLGGGAWWEIFNFPIFFIGEPILFFVPYGSLIASLTYSFVTGAVIGLVVSMIYWKICMRSLL